MGSKELHFNRTTSAGYRLAERPNADILTGHSKPAANSRTQGKPTYLGTVQEDQVWRELIRAEWRGHKEWENNWSFLKDYDTKGQLKIHEPLPEYIPQFSDQVPNTTNQTCGSRIDTELGQALIQLDFRLQKESRKRKPDMELIPY